MTNENVREYVDLYVDWLLNRSVAPHFDAFRKGFVKVGSCSRTPRLIWHSGKSD